MVIETIRVHFGKGNESKCMKRRKKERTMREIVYAAVCMCVCGVTDVPDLTIHDHVNEF
jgi:hypothetical protein